MLDKDNGLSEEAMNSNFGISDAAPLAGEPGAPAAPTHLVAAGISSRPEGASGLQTDGAVPLPVSVDIDLSGNPVITAIDPPRGTVLSKVKSSARISRHRRDL